MLCYVPGGVANGQKGDTQITLIEKPFFSREGFSGFRGCSAELYLGASSYSIVIGKSYLLA